MSLYHCNNGESVDSANKQIIYQPYSGLNNGFLTVDLEYTAPKRGRVCGRIMNNGANDDSGYIYASLNDDIFAYLNKPRSGEQQFFVLDVYPNDHFYFTSQRKGVNDIVNLTFYPID